MMEPPPSRPEPTWRAERRRVQALDDRALVLAMRAGEPVAWNEFAARARAVLVGVMPDDQLGDDVVGDVLTHVGLHLARADAPIPTRLAPYLVRAAVRAGRQRARNARRRHAWHVRAVREDVSLALPDGYDVAGSLFSEYARRAAGVPDARVVDEPAVRALVERLLGDLSPDDAQLLTWNVEGVPHRQIAVWLDLSYAAVAKRVQRLLKRLGTRAAALVADASAADRAALARVLREPRPSRAVPDPHALERR